ncbi:hypothetical protein M407DRAFT_30407 [Tulasnella calospora MUT 4182]|uniref:Uncharacterized protein n=1 Tax=Tulasnella calospora MUT 4182 TaxID=1051891 RepID=A0A0C3Q7D7_9AGAM|nr:hypothetical protein M407DRAFT_30407 [Tulasnella calospora MUT 4182]
MRRCKWVEAKSRSASTVLRANHLAYDENRSTARVEVLRDLLRFTSNASKFVEVGCLSKQIEVYFDNFELRGNTTWTPVYSTMPLPNQPTPFDLHCAQAVADHQAL